MKPLHKIACTLGLAGLAMAASGAERVIDWADQHNHLWLGGELWGNRLHDWAITNGALECLRAEARLPLRTAHCLTTRIRSGEGTFRMTVIARPVADAAPARASAGFLVGAGRDQMDYRSAAIIHCWPGMGFGLYAGINAEGQIFIRDLEQPQPTMGPTPDRALPRDDWTVLFADSAERGNEAHNALDGDPATIWHTEWKEKKPTHPHSIVIDLGREQPVNGLAILPRQENSAGRIKEYSLHLGATTNDWGAPVVNGQFENSDQIQSIDFPPVKARFAKLVALSAFNDRPSTTVAEVYLLGARRTAAQALRLPATAPAAGRWTEVEVRLEATVGAQQGRLRVTAVAPGTDRVLGATEMEFPAARFAGGIALVSDNGRQAGGRFAFQRWTIAGDLVAVDESRMLGAILSAQHTVSRGIMKLTAQLMPVEEQDGNRVVLQLERQGAWKDAAEAEVMRPSYTAPFRIPNWDASRDCRYRLVYEQALRGGSRRTWTWSGTIRRDPVEKTTIVVAGFTGNHNNSHRLVTGPPDYRPNRNWITDMFFPHAEVVRSVQFHHPDVLFFSGDQVYEGDSPTFPDAANIIPDYLYKWYLWCWAYRDLTRNAPAMTIPDDHDVYQGNLWGQGGRKSPDRDHDGGYVHPAEFVKVCERTQTSHLPDPWYDKPLEQGLTAYYTSMNYGRIGFAVLEDRKFKSGCNRPDMPPSGTARPDHFNDPNFDVKRLDIPGVELLGKDQERFVQEWAADWAGHDLKMALSQTIFANMATHHGGGLQRLMCDLDSNGWPQAGRNRAINALRRGFVFHLAGDQHLATIVHHGVDDWGDAIWSFCVPSVANFYPRAWAPKCGEPYVFPAPEDHLGRFRDGFGHPVIVHATTNPGRRTGHEPAVLHDNMPGYGIVRLNKQDATYTMECWPRHANPADPGAKPYEGWPKTISLFDNYARKPSGHLPEIRVTGLMRPVVQVIREDGNEIEYTLRAPWPSFRPTVFSAGSYTVRVGEPDENRWKTLRGLKPDPNGQIEVTF